MSRFVLLLVVVLVGCAGSGPQPSDCVAFCATRGLAVCSWSSTDTGDLVCTCEDAFGHCPYVAGGDDESDAGASE